MNMYNILNYIGAAALIIYNLVRIKERRILTDSRARKWVAKRRISGKEGLFVKDSFLLVAESIIISLFQYAPILIFNRVIGDIFGTGVNYFGLLYLAPVSLGLGCLVLGTDLLNQMDLVTPAFPLALFFSKLGCFCAGCCEGIACEFGIPNAFSGIKEFPIQLLEAVVALLIFVFFMKYRKNLKVGTAFPIYAMLYSAIRFFTEFLSANEVDFLGLKTYQMMCLIGLIVGAMEYYLAITDKRNMNQEDM